MFLCFLCIDIQIHFVVAFQGFCVCVCVVYVVCAFLSTVWFTGQSE